MTADVIFAPITAYQLKRGKKATNKQIALDCGMTEKRVGRIRKNPSIATVQEIERLTDQYKFGITI